MLRMWVDRTEVVIQANKITCNDPWLLARLNEIRDPLGEPTSKVDGDLALAQRILDRFPGSIVAENDPIETTGPPDRVY